MDRIGSAAKTALWPRSVRQSILDAVSAGVSLWLLGPRFFGKGPAALALLEHASATHGGAVAVLDETTISMADAIDWDRVWQAISTKIPGNTRCPAESVSGPQEFRNVLSGLLSASPDLFLTVGVLGVHPHCVRNYFEIASVLHATLQELTVRDRRNVGRLQCLIPDEFVLWYHHQPRLTTPWRAFERVEIPFLAIDDVEGLNAVLGERLSEAAAEALLQVTGGHIGLTFDTLTSARPALLRKGVRYERRVSEIKTIIRDLPIAQRLIHALRGDSDLVSAATRFYEEQIFQDVDEPVIQRLLQLGLIRRVSPLCATLSGQFVRELVEDLAGVRYRRPTPATPLRLSARSSTSDREDTVRILHLSDLHFGRQHHWRLPSKPSRSEPDRRTLVEAVVDDLRNADLAGNIDLLILTGDIADKPDPDFYEEAQAALEQLTRDLGIAAQSVLLVPGNHDCNLSPRGGQNRTAGAASMSAYAFFSRSLLTGSARHDLVQATSPSKAVTVQCVGTSSCCAIGRSTQNYGAVETSALRTLTCTLQAEASTACGDAVHRFLCLHHHVTPVGNFPTRIALRGKAPSVMLNAPELMSWASSNEIVGVLHGHHHQPFLGSFQRWAGGKIQRRIVVAGAGSCGVVREQLDSFARSHYFVHVVGRDAWVVKSRALDEEGGAFCAHQELVIPLDVQAPDAIAKLAE